jgi:hypothetical protein
MRFSSIAANGLVRKLLIAALTLILRLAFLGSSSSPQVRSFRPQTQIAPKAQQVEIGLYANNLYDLDIASNTYHLDA